MDTWTSILTVLATGLCYYFFKRKNVFEKLKIPHESPLPLLGNMSPCLFGRINLTDFIQELYQKYAHAKYFGIYDFQIPVVVLRDAEIINSITIKNFKNFPDRRGLTDSKLDPLLGRGLFSLKGDKWRDMRTILLPSYTSSKMKIMFHLITECAVNFTNIIHEQSKKEDYIENLKDIFTKVVADMIFSCAFGINTNSMKEPNNELYVAARKATDFNGILSLKFLLHRNCKLISQVLGVRIISGSISRFLTSVIASNIQSRRERGITRQDFLQMMMEAEHKNSSGQQFTNQEITANSLMFIFGGLDTVSTQLCYVFHEIALNSDVQVRLQEEIDSVLENCKGEPTYSEFNNMSYMDAVINESTRIHPAASFIDRICKQKFELPPPVAGGEPVTLEPGTSIWIPVFSLQRDSTYYENPEKFDPERFLGESKVNANVTPFSPFGIGPRMCIGRRFALLIMKVVLFHLLSRCNFKICSKTPASLKFKKNTIALLPEGGFWLKFESRK